MRFLSSFVFILFNIYLIESANRTESENSQGTFESEKSEFVPGDGREGRNEQEEVSYDEYEDARENSISGRNEKPRGNSSESEGSVEGFPNEVFLSLRNITADAATAFRSFTNRNDVVDLQASASDNLNLTVNTTFGDAESAGINLRILRDAGHPPHVIDDGGGGIVHLPYKHTKIDTADLSDCALQGEWKPMGVAHGHLHVGDDHSNPHQVEVLQSVGSYSVPSKIIPLWQQNQGAIHHKPSGLYATGTSGGSYGPGFGYGSGSGVLANAFAGSNGGPHFASNAGSGGFSGSGLGHFHKIKTPAMLSPPPIPPIIFGKKPGFWKLPKTKHKFLSGTGKGRRPFPGGSYGFPGHLAHGGPGFGHAGGYSGVGGGGFLISGGSGHLGHDVGEGGPAVLKEVIKGGGGGIGVSGYGSGGGGGIGVSGYGSGGGGGGGIGVSGYGSGGSGGSSLKGEGFGGGVVGGFSTSGGAPHGLGGGNGGVLSLSEGAASSGHVSHGVGGGAVAEHLIAATGGLDDGAGSESGVGVEEEVSGGHGYVPGDEVAGGQLISGSAVGSAGGEGVLVLSSGGLPGGGIGGDNGRPEAGFLSAELVNPSGQYVDSSFSSTHIRQGLRGANSLPDAAFLSSHINQDFANHGQGVSDDLSSSSTFTCGKNHDHNTNYHTATFQVADHDHPSSVDVLQYGGDAAVLIQSGGASFHDQILPERKHYKTSHLSDAEVSGSDNRNELVGQTVKLTSNPSEDVGQIEADPTKHDDGEEPERHSYYHEITKVTKIPATSVGSVQYTFSQYETKPQTFSTESDVVQEEEPEVEQPQIVRELEHLSNKFQLDLENPQKLFEDPPSQELAYHYPFQEGGNPEGPKKDLPEGITEFPYQFYNANKAPLQPLVYKKPVVQYFPRPGKPHFYQKTTVNYLQPKPPLILVRKPKPKHLLKKKQNYEVREHGGERHKHLGEVFPPQKFPKQFHNPKPNFAVDRPKTGWRPEVQEYKFEHGKKIRKLNTKTKLVAPVLIRRPVSPAPVIRVVEVAG